jgi:hypothetical protein
MYSKIFKTIFDGSLHGNFDATVTFMALIVLAERGGIVDMTPKAIAAQCGYPIDVIERGIAELEMPDPQSRTPDEEGRRILRMDCHRDWGWRITNFDTYHAMRTREDRREYFRARIALKRAAARAMSPNVTPVTNVSEITYSDSDSDSDVNKDLRVRKDLDRAAARPLVETDFAVFQKLYPKRAGSQRWADAQKHINARLREGVTWERILKGTTRYAAYCRVTGKVHTETVQQAATFVGKNLGFDEPWDLPLNGAEAKVDQNISASQDWLQAQESKDAKT